MAAVELAGSRVLVLGGSGVLGRSIAGIMQSRGAQVVIAGRDRDRLQEAAAQLGGVASVQGDLAVAGGSAAIVEAAAGLLGGLDGLVNAAGAVAFGDFEDLEDSVLDDLIAANLTGPLRAIRAASPRIEAGGFVVSISGVVAESPVAGMAAYSGVKAALSTTTRALTRELRRRKIHVLDARPPHTETGLATRPIAGAAPALPPGLDPALVATAIVDALVDGRRELPSADFAP